MENKIKSLLSDLDDDSKTIVENAKTEILTICKPIIDKIQTLSRIYHFDGGIISSEYQNDHGELSLDCDVYSDEEGFYINYRDSWAQGGYCDLEIFFKYEWFESDFFEKLEKKLRENRIKYIETSIKRLKYQIEEYVVELNKFKNNEII